MDALGGVGGLGGGDLQARAQLALDRAQGQPELRQAGEGVDDAAKRFEGLIASMLVKELRQTLPEGFFGDGPGADIYAGWLDTHLSEALSANDALGIAGMVKAELGRIANSEAGEVPQGER